MEFFCPFPSAINPATDWAELHTAAWAERWGLLPTLEARIAFRNARFAELMGRAYPYADPATLATIADWNSWTFLVDTQLDHHELGQQPAILADFAATVIAILGDAPCVRNPWWPPLLTALTSIADRLRPWACADWLRRFRANVAATMAMCVREAEYRRMEMAPSEAVYLQMRPYTSGTYCFLDLIEIADAAILPDAVRRHPALVRLVELTNESVYLANDLASLEKELLQGDGNNLVIIAQHEQGLSLEAARAYVMKRHDRAVAAFVQQRDLLPAFDADTDQRMARYVAGLAAWMRANLDWSKHTGRYQVASEVMLAREVHAVG